MERRRPFLLIGRLGVFVNMVMLTRLLPGPQFCERVVTSRSGATLATFAARFAFLLVLLTFQRPPIVPMDT